MSKDGMGMLKFALISLVVACTAQQPLTVEGNAIQGGMMLGQTLPGSEVSLDGESLPVAADGSFVFGFHRDAPAQARLEVRLPSGERVTRTIDVADREYDIQRIDGLPPSQVTPDEAQLKRIREEAARVAAARARRDERKDYASEFQWPARGVISGVYGSQRILNGSPRRPHYGVDVAAPTGTPVYAPAPGIVTLAEPDLYFSGGTLIVDHGMGVSSSFLHLSAIHVEVGERVEKGQKIAEIGATGRVTGPHLDWRMNVGAARIDPRLLVRGDPPPLTD